MSHSELFGLKGQKQSGLASKHGEEYFERESAQERERLDSAMRPEENGPTIKTEKGPKKPSDSGPLPSKLLPSLKPPKAQEGNRRKSGNFFEDISLPGDGNAYDGVVGMGRRL